MRISGLRNSLLLLLLLSTAACGGSSDAAGRRTIAVIPKGTSHVFWKSVHAGAVKAAAERGVEILWKGPAREDDRAEQVKVVETMVIRGVDGILIAPLDDRALVRPLKEAAAAGIPVVVFDSDVSWDGRKSFVATDNRRGGELAAERMGTALGGAGKVVVLRYQVGSASTMKREEGFLEVLGARFPDIEILSSDQHGGATEETCLKTAENLLIRFPEVDGVYGPCEPVTAAWMRALSGAGKGGRVKLVGFDATDSLVAGLRKGTIDALVVQDPFTMGEKGLHALVDALDGKPVETFVDTGVTVITADAMDSAANKRLLSPNLSKWLK